MFDNEFQTGVCGPLGAAWNIWGKKSAVTVMCKVVANQESKQEDF